MEEWKQCYETLLITYYVSNKGNIKSILKNNNKEKILKKMICGSDYYRLRISKKQLYIHHLVAKCFIGNRPENCVVDHIDRNPLNNCVENLRYCSTSENVRNSNSFRKDILVEDINERRKLYRKGKKYECECGSIIRLSGKSQHFKTKKHLEYVKNNL